ADAPAVANALRGAADAAYRAVRRPVEGTMLTVVREMAEEAQSQSPHAASVQELLPRVLRRGEEALDRTPELLDVLREAGVGDATGTIDRIEIANMHRQTEQREERLLATVPPPARTAVVAVAAGAGNRRLFESLGAARVVEGGQSMNPATAELVAAIDEAAGDDVLVLPNNANVLLTAEQAVGMATRPARVVPATTIPAGLAAMV